jgi:hypothetical protein
LNLQRLEPLLGIKMEADMYENRFYFTVTEPFAQGCIIQKYWYSPDSSNIYENVCSDFIKPLSNFMSGPFMISPLVTV